MKTKTYYVYLIRNTVDNKNYIGITNNVGRRWNQHIKYGLQGFRKSKDERKAVKGLYADMNRLGVNKFVFNILETIETASEKEAYKREISWIKKLDPITTGYNSILDSKKIMAEAYKKKKIAEYEAKRIVS